MTSSPVQRRTAHRRIFPVVLLVLIALALLVQPSGARSDSFVFIKDFPTNNLVAKQHGAAEVWKFDTGTVSCNEATYSGTSPGTESTELLLEPTYSECNAFGLFNVPVHTNKCMVAVKPDTKVAGQYEGRTDIVCPAGKVMEVTAPGCTVTVGSQTGLKQITFTNVGAGSTKELTVDMNIPNGVQYEEHRPLFGICANKTVPKSNGSLSGAFLLTALFGGHIGIRVGP